MAAGVGSHRGLETGTGSHIDPMMFSFSSPFASEAQGDGYDGLDRQGWDIMFRSNPTQTPTPDPTPVQLPMTIPSQTGLEVPNWEPTGDGGEGHGVEHEEKEDYTDQ